MKNREYDRVNVLEYAKMWAYSRNPKYYNFDSIGGDCTNFVSQCIYEGSKIMNYSKKGWFYKNGSNKSPSWTGVEFLHRFLINNKEIGPYGEEVGIKEIEIGDIAQLSFDGIEFSHSLLIVKINENKNLDDILVATHTFDSLYRKISTYNFKKIRFIHIQNVRI